MSKDPTIHLSDLVEKYTEPLYSHAFYKVSDAELAKDLVQETFLAAAENIESFKKESTPKTWLMAILNNKIIDFYRSKNKLAQPTEPQDFSQFFNEHKEWHSHKKPMSWNNEDRSLLDDSEFQQILKDCLKALPAQWSTCVKLKFLTEKKGKEICQELEISPSNYWQIIHRAKLQLRDCIENKWIEN